MRSLSRAAASVTLLGAAWLGCRAPTASSSLEHPTVAEVEAYHARWASHGLSSYSFTYAFDGNTALAGQRIRLAVRLDTVRSAVVLSTNTVLDATGFPTVDTLFAIAIGAASRDSLRFIAFDPTYDFPDSLDIVGIPDGLTSVSATALQPSP